MARVKGISVSDFLGASNTGILGEQISVTLTLDEPVTATNGSINSSTVIPSFSLGGAVNCV